KAPARGAATTPSAPPQLTPPTLHELSLADLRFIRRTMEGAAAFTTLSGAGLVAIGLSALGAGVLAGAAPGPAWLRVWIVEAGLALVVGVLATLAKTRTARLPLLSGPLRKFGLAPGAPWRLVRVLQRAGDGRSGRRPRRPRCAG